MGRTPSQLALGQGNCSIPRRSVDDLTVQQFFDDYVDQGKPVLLYGKSAVVGDVVTKWAKEGFLQAYGHRQVTVVDSAQVSQGKMGDSAAAEIDRSRIILSRVMRI